MTSIVIADDHDIIRKGLRSIISADPAYKVVGEAANGGQAVSLVNELKPDVLLLDITMPGATGLDIISSIKNLSSGTKILMISVHKADVYVSKALATGANGYLLKDSAAEELMPALRKISAGRIYLGSSISSSLAQRLSPEGGSGLSKPAFTSREKEVLRLLSEGKTAKEIAVLLDISARTVENYKNNLLKKLGLSRTVELVKYSFENGLID